MYRSRERGKAETVSSDLLVHSLNAHSGLGWDRPKLKAWKSIQTFYLGGRNAIM